MQNDWLLFDRNSFVNNTDRASFALRTFETYLGNAYVLPDSGVFLFQKFENNVWEIWNGFRVSKKYPLIVFQIGLTSPNYLKIDLFNHERSNFRGEKLKATSVVISDIIN